MNKKVVQELNKVLFKDKLQQSVSVVLYCENVVFIIEQEIVKPQHLGKYIRVVTGIEFVFQ